MLQAIFEFQSMVCEITSMDIANASLYDGSHAIVETALLMVNAKRGAKKVLVSETIHPFALKALGTWVLGTEYEVVPIQEKDGVVDLSNLVIGDDVGGLIVQSPNRYGFVEDYTGMAELLHERKALFAISSDPLSLAIQKTPGQWGADIAVGDTQSLGLSLAFGGPSCGYMAVKRPLLRKIPGRLVGITTDAEGRGFLTPSSAGTASSVAGDGNICSNQALAALMTTIHLSSLGQNRMVEAVAILPKRYLAHHLGQLPGVVC